MQKPPEHFAQTINQLKGKVTMLFITHALPKSLMVDGDGADRAGRLDGQWHARVGDCLMERPP